MRFSVCLSEAGRLLQGHRRSWRDQTLFRVAVPPTLHAPHPRARPLGWKDRHLRSLFIPWTVGLSAETY